MQIAVAARLAPSTINYDCYFIARAVAYIALVLGVWSRLASAPADGFDLVMKISLGLINTSLARSGLNLIIHPAKAIP